RAIDETELRDDRADGVVGVPAAAAEEARLEAALAQPFRLGANARGRVPAGRARVRRARPVRVQPEHVERACTLEPQPLVLAVRGVGRTDEGDDVEASRAVPSQRV